jgi:hypothetical protein
MQALSDSLQVVDLPLVDDLIQLSNNAAVQQLRPRCAFSEHVVKDLRMMVFTARRRVETHRKALHEAARVRAELEDLQAFEIKRDKLDREVDVIVILQARDFFFLPRLQHTKFVNELNAREILDEWIGPDVDDLERRSVAEDSKDIFCLFGTEISRNWFAFKVRRNETIFQAVFEIHSKSQAMR